MFNLLSAVLNHKNRVKQSSLPAIFYQTSSLALNLPSRGYYPAGKPHFSEINPLMLIWQQHKAKSKPTFLVFLIANSPNSGADREVHWICESMQGCHLFRLVLVG